jgi:Rrf2 family cysteine metabolism transcriptional repressor
VKISTRGRYGTRLLLDLAMHNGCGPVPLKEIAERQQISLLYLEHLVAPLLTAGLIRSTRGAHGGIWLAKSPETIRLSEVVKLLEGPIAPADCVSDREACPRSDACVTRDVWMELKRAMDGVLESKSLQDLVDMQKKKDQSDMVTYDI